MSTAEVPLSIYCISDILGEYQTELRRLGCLRLDDTAEYCVKMRIGPNYCPKQNISLWIRRARWQHAILAHIIKLPHERKNSCGSYFFPLSQQWYTCSDKLIDAINCCSKHQFVILNELYAKERQAEITNIQGLLDDNEGEDSNEHYL